MSLIAAPNRSSYRYCFGSSCIVIALLFVNMLALSACSGSANKAVDTMLAVGSRKKQMLQKRVDRFHQAMYWGDASAAAAFAAVDNRNVVFKKAKKVRKSERYVDIAIEHVNFVESNRAEVTIAVQYFRVPAYIIKTRVEKETWKFFRYEGGWLLTETKVVDDEGNDEGKSA